jgi:hypothetical protein
LFVLHTSIREAVGRRGGMGIGDGYIADLGVQVKELERRLWRFQMKVWSLVAVSCRCGQYWDNSDGMG